MPRSPSLRVLSAVLVALSAAALGDEFSDLVPTFGTTTRLIGTRQSTTNNPDGTGINFWLSAYEGTLAINVPLSNPHMVQADAYGNLYIADKASHSVLKITTDGLIHTFAGTHVAGFNGDGPAPATSLQLNNTNGLFVFPDGTVFLLDPGNHRIRRVTPDGTMTTIVNDLEPNWYPSGRGLWVSPDQQLIYYTNEFAPVPPSIIADGACVKKWTAANGIETICQKSVGFRNPANLAVNPVDGQLYVTDRAEEDPTFIAIGVWRIDGVDARTRITGNATQPVANDGQLAVNSYFRGVRGIAFLPNGAYFLCSHKEGSIWYVDTGGVIHRYLRGFGSNDFYSLPDNNHPPLTTLNYFTQPRAVTIAPNGDLLAVCCDSGFIFRVNSVVPHVPPDLRVTHYGADGARLSWVGLFGRGYLVERTLSLNPASWQTLGAVGGNAGGVSSQFLDAAAAAQSRAFYRIESSH